MPQKQIVGGCRLCRQHRPLRRSHIMPAFVVHWLKKTSATGHIRFSNNPNRRMQDALRLPILCEDCEQRISGWESAFGREMFPKVAVQAPLPYHYGRWMLLFGVSLCWRVLVSHLERGAKLVNLSEAQKDAVPDTLDRWRGFMMGEYPHPGVHGIHFLNLGAADSYTGPRPPVGLNWYLARALDQDVLGSTREDAYVFAKPGPGIFVGVITPPRRQEWRGTMLHVNQGMISGQMTVPGGLGKFLNSRVEIVRSASASLSREQRDRIAESYLSQPERAARSDTMKAFDADVRMFGEEAVFRSLVPPPPPRRI